MEIMEKILGCAPTWAVIAMTLDIVTGYYQAWCNYSIESGAMRKGLRRKGSEVLLIVVVVLFNIMISRYNAFQIPPEAADFIQLVSVDGVCSYIILKELTSVCENLGKANPELAELPFMQHMKGNREISEGKYQEK